MSMERPRSSSESEIVESPQRKQEILPNDADVIHAGNKELRAGDMVTVERSNGAIENDWILSTFDSRYATVIKPNENGEPMRKVIPLNEFISKQATETTAQNDTLRIGNRELRRGDSVAILRSSGEMEKDWILKDFGNNLVTTEKIDPSTGQRLTKKGSLNQFILWQTAAEKGSVTPQESGK